MAFDTTEQPQEPVGFQMLAMTNEPEAFIPLVPDMVSSADAARLVASTDQDSWVFSIMLVMWHSFGTFVPLKRDEVLSFARTSHIPDAEKHAKDALKNLIKNEIIAEEKRTLTLTEIGMNILRLAPADPKSETREDTSRSTLSDRLGIKVSTR